MNIVKNIPRRYIIPDNNKVWVRLSSDKIPKERSMDLSNLNEVPCLISFAKNWVEDDMFDNLFPILGEILLLPLGFYFD